MEQQEHKTWFSRNWTWAVPVGGCLTIIVIGAILVGIALVKMPELLNNIEPVKYGITRALENDEIKDVLGEPIEVDRHGETDGTFSINNSNSDIDMTFPLKGPKGKASLIIRGKKVDDEWHYTELYIQVKETNNKINLLDKSLDDL